MGFGCRDEDIRIWGCHRTGCKFQTDDPKKLEEHINVTRHLTLLSPEALRHEILMLQKELAKYD